MPRTPWFLMCPPEHFGIHYEINPWMSRARDADRDRAQIQWERLRNTIDRLGCKISLLEPVDGLPDMVFTANAGLMYHNKFISSQFRHDVRARESEHFDRWFHEQGFTVHHLQDGMYFEGAGDALFCGERLFAGYRIRSDAQSHQTIAELLGCQALPTELVDERFYHLDTCFCPLTADSALWFPSAFDEYGQAVIRQNVPRLIEAPEQDAVRFACNAVIINKTVIMPAGCAATRAKLESHGHDVHEVELDEFLKAGGAAKCLTLRVDGENAATWAD